ncbi:hypothetical protein DRP77_02530, partial [Candidatus Poribacteria bacterium]
MRGKWAIAAILSVICAVAWADVSVNGFLKTETRLRVQEERELTWNRAVLSLKFEGEPSEGLHFLGDLRLKSSGFPTISSLPDLQSWGKEGVSPWAVELKEAYLDVYSFLVESLDLRLGKQIVVWGTADKINPTSNICPDDLEDIFDFGEKIGVNAIQLNWYPSLGGADLTVSGVFVPTFTPSTLPPPRWIGALMEEGVPEIPGLKVEAIEERIALPEPSLKESSSFGLRLSTTLAGYDLSVSYYRGRDKLPIQSSLTLKPKVEVELPAGGMPSGLTPGEGQPPVGPELPVEGVLELIYPKIQVIGADMAGELFKVGIWAEGALFLPEEVEMKTTLPTPQGPTTRSEVVLEDEPYLKFVLGCDYTFKDGTYVNFQYIHGFPFERGKDELNDYFAFRLERKFHDDEVKLVPLSFVLSVTDWDDPSENYGLAYVPELSYSPRDNIELTLGAVVLHGKGEGFLSKLK